MKGGADGCADNLSEKCPNCGEVLKESSSVDLVEELVEKAEEMKILSLYNKNSKDFVIHISRPKLYISQAKYIFKHENIYII